MSQNTPTSSRRRVCIGFRPGPIWYRQIIFGIRQYIEAHEPWDLIFLNYIQQFTLKPDDFRVLGHIDGIFAGAEFDFNDFTANIPLVRTEFTQAHPVHPHTVATDMQAVGAMAAEHLLSLGLKQFAAFTSARENHIAADRRIQGFEQLIIEKGHPCPVFNVGPRTAERGHWMFADQIADLSDFLQTLPKPLGLFVVDAAHTWRAILACQNAELRIPEQIAIICGGEDEVVFENLKPTITGIQYDSTRVGYEAAAALDKLMTRQAVEEPKLIPPKTVVARQSTDFIPTDDPDVRAAIRYIWTNIADRPTISDVAKHVLISERTLQRRFQQELRRQPSDELQTARLETAKRLLRDTHLPFIQIASKSGYVSQAQLSRYIKQATGKSPTEFRREG